MSYAGAIVMYPTYVSDILIARGDFAADWWEMVAPRVEAHRKMGTPPEELADLFSEEWRVIRETGGWKGNPNAKPEASPAASDLSKAMRDTLRYCAAARRRGFA